MEEPKIMQKTAAKTLRRFAPLILPLMICTLCLFAGCNTTKNSTKNKFAFPSMPKWGAKEHKPKKDPHAPRTVEEFIAAERPSVY
jgi:hypothetical protein